MLLQDVRAGRNEQVLNDIKASKQPVKNIQKKKKKRLTWLGHNLKHEGILLRPWGQDPGQAKEDVHETTTTCRHVKTLQRRLMQS